MFKLIIKRILSIIMFFITIGTIITFGKALPDFKGDGGAQLVFIIIIMVEFFCIGALWRKPKRRDTTYVSYGPFDWL